MVTRLDHFNCCVFVEQYCSLDNILLTRAFKIGLFSFTVFMDGVEIHKSCFIDTIMIMCTMLRGRPTAEC